MIMPKVVCSTTEWVLTIRLSEIISKKGCQDSGIPWVLPNRISEIIQNVAQMIGMTLLGYVFPAFRCILVYAPRSRKPYPHPWSPYLYHTIEEQEPSSTQYGSLNIVETSLQPTIVTSLEDEASTPGHQSIIRSSTPCHHSLIREPTLNSTKYAILTIVATSLQLKIPSFMHPKSPQIAPSKKLLPKPRL